MTTLYQESLLEQAMHYWLRGESLPLNLFASMASEGMDVERLEAIHKED